MPKKRQHFKQYSKPQSTPPASLVSSSTSPRSANHDDQPGRSVNELLADLRRVSLRSQQVPENASDFAAPGAPTVPPAIRRILRLPETPAPPPRRPVRLAPNGRRLPPGPAAPRSWLSQSIHAPRRHGSDAVRSSDSFERHALPGAYAPAPRSLVDITLRKLAEDWEFQQSYNRYYIYSLPNHLKVALISYLGMWYPPGLSVSNLRAILAPYVDDDTPDFPSDTDTGLSNEDICHLDLTGSIGRGLKLRELSDLLFPQHSIKASQADLQESWDSSTTVTTPSIPLPLLPNLTHLSLALDPRRPPSSSSTVSWRHLLSFAAHLPTLTHLSLANWPEPTLTPNAKLTSVLIASPSGSSRSVQYGGTGPYSHSLDDDWSEAVLVLRRLSKLAYGLEWLDLTGCGAWAAALSVVVEGDSVDWVGDWGKVGRVVMDPGYRLGHDAGLAERERYDKDVALAGTLERHVRRVRAGKGRGIVVETVGTAGGL